MTITHPTIRLAVSLVLAVILLAATPADAQGNVSCARPDGTIVDTTQHVRVSSLSVPRNTVGVGLIDCTSRQVSENYEVTVTVTIQGIGDDDDWHDLAQRTCQDRSVVGQYRGGCLVSYAAESGTEFSSTSHRLLVKLHTPFDEPPVIIYPAASQ